MFRYSLIFAIVLACTNVAAANWAESLFAGRSRDFGSVPRGPVVSHPFRLVNKTGGTLYISNVRVSCGCVTAYALKRKLAPGESSAIVARMDTGRFKGSRTVTIFVNFSQPNWTEVRLWVRANSRADISVTPETLAFGRIKRGASPKRSVNISLYGNEGYRILSLSADSNYIKPVCRMTRRDGSRIQYTLTAQLRSDTPPGRWYTDIWLRTNNPAMPSVRVPLTVEIESALSVSPTSVILGKVKIGAVQVRKIIVRGVQPFRITKVRGTDHQIRVRDSSDKKRSVHILTVTMRPQRSGQVERRLLVETDLPGDSTIDFTTRAYVVP